MRCVKTHKFNGIKYDIDFCGPIDGNCDYPKGQRPSIRILCNPESKNGLITLIHESLHAENWAITEEVVDRVSTEIGNLLWKLGYRKIK